jgi:hypothetical protein
MATSKSLNLHAEGQIAAGDKLTVKFGSETVIDEKVPTGMVWDVDINARCDELAAA